jgi:hypothetical protein
LADSLQLTIIAGLNIQVAQNHFHIRAGEPQMALKKSGKLLKAGKKIESIKPLSSDRLGVRKLARLVRPSSK